MVIRSLNNLHAKIYIFDDSKALVTSANATNAGMWRNLECGLSTDDRRRRKAVIQVALKQIR